MIWFIAVLLLVPLSAAAWIAIYRRPDVKGWNPYLTRIGILTLIGAFAAGPFITTRALGTSEAYNYGLAVADAVTQVREGVFPVLVGQSEFAFNGRIHPLRTAPYLTNFAAFLDLLTFRNLNFWALQNLALAMSLLLGAFTCYVSLRRSTSTSPATALTLTATYLLAPGVMAAAYAMDLYMTVMTVPFLPIVVAGNLVVLKGDARLKPCLAVSLALGACWWCHPPIALWSSFATVLIQAAALATGKLGWTQIKRLGVAGLVGALLISFVVVSALTVRSYDSISAARAPQAVVLEVEQAFVASLAPVSPDANKLGDFQLGYALWALFSLGLIVALIRRQWSAFFLFSAAAVLLLFTIPVPGITAWLWDHTPTFAITMNGPWPMQRVYLVSSILIVFAVAQLGLRPDTSRLPKIARDALGLVAAALSVWAVYQGWRFIERGYGSRNDEAYTRYSHYSENINPTLIAYAMFTLPPWFANGVMDPVMETRVLKRGTAAQLISNWTAEEALGTEVARGRLSAGSSGSGDTAELMPRLKLEPGKKYRLDLNFLSPPLQGALRLIGTNTIRVYPLPQSGEPKSFGMQPGNNRSLTLWTSAAETEIVTVQLIGSGMGSARLLNFADFVLREYHPEKLPIAVESWVPFRAKVRTPEAGYLEIPRTFIDGYAATVNGMASRVQSSPDRLVMTAVPAGESTVEVAHPGSTILRGSFAVSLGTLIASAAFLIATGVSKRATATSAELVRAADRWLWRKKIIVVGALLVLGAGLFGWQRWSEYRDAAGPIRLKLVLPRGEIGRSQPLLTTGAPSKGAFIFVIYKDETHIQVGVDVWGQGFYQLSEPIAVDYFSEHEFVISSGALYPSGHPKLKNLSSAQIEALRNRITVDVNGVRALDAKAFSFDSPRSAVTVGENRIQGSSTEPRFVGQVLEQERLPSPAP